MESIAEGKRREVSDGTPTQATFPSFALNSQQHEHDSDDHNPGHSEEDDDGDDDYQGPSFSIPYKAPQLGLLSLPSPTFGASVSDLLAPLQSLSTSTSLRSSPSPVPGSRPPSRLRTSSNISRTSVYNHPTREPTLNFSKPRESADKRVRREGKVEECWIAEFPEETMELSRDDPKEWLEEEWIELGEFLKERGYEIDAGGEMKREHVPAHRISDSLPLHLTLVPIDDVSYELDILEHLAQAGIRSHASAQNIIPKVPIVGIVPLSEDWSAVLMERWEKVDLRVVANSQDGIKGFILDIVGAISFLHSQHISHLSISPLSILSSPPSATKPTRYSLTTFVNSHQSDPLSKKLPRVSNAADASVPIDFVPPEMKEAGGGGKKYDPFKADMWALGMVLKAINEVSSPPSTPLDQIVKNLINPVPAERKSAPEVLSEVKKIFE